MNDKGRIRRGAATRKPSPARVAVTPRPGRHAAPPSSADQELARLAKALGHPARVAILRLLIGRGECVCGSIVDHLPLAQATVSQHLKVLRDAGLIHGDIDPPRVCYCVAPERLERLKQMISSL